jgi:hypothetical protein
MATYAIPEANLDELTKRLGRLSARAIHCGVDAITWTTVGEEYRPHPRKKNVQVRYVLLEVHGETPRVHDGDGNEYTFVAAIDHGFDQETEERINLIRKARDVEGDVPVEFRSAEPHCDHCHTERPRRKTYLLRDYEGHYTQVGSSCLADFLRTTDPDDLAAMFENLYEALHLAEAEDEWESSERTGTEYTALALYLAHVCTMVRTDGYFLSRKSCEGREGWASVPTSERAWMNLNPSRGQESTEPTPEDEEKALAVIAWGKSLNDRRDLNDYLFNLSVLARMGYITWRHQGLAASMVGAYMREQGEALTKTSEPRKPSQHQGEVGKKLEATVTVERRVDIPGYAYNSTRDLYLMADQDGNAYTWTTQGEPLDEGKTYRLLGTVKEHSEYHGRKQTRLTRCKVLEEVGNVEG